MPSAIESATVGGGAGYSAESMLLRLVRCPGINGPRLRCSTPDQTHNWPASRRAVVLGCATSRSTTGWFMCSCPSSTRRMTVGFVTVSRASSMPIPWHRGGLPCSPPPRAVLDGCLTLSALADVRALLAESVQRGLTRVDRLDDAFSHVARRGSTLVRVALDDIRSGCRSAPECELRNVLRTSPVLPEPRWNVPVYGGNGEWLGIPNAWFAVARLALEVNSVEHHFYGVPGKEPSGGSPRSARLGCSCCRSRHDGSGLSRLQCAARSKRRTASASLRDGGWRGTTCVRGSGRHNSRILGRNDRKPPGKPAIMRDSRDFGLARRHAAVVVASAFRRSYCAEQCRRLT